MERGRPSPKPKADGNLAKNSQSDGVAKHSLKKKITVSGNQKSATGESPCSADFVFRPVQLDHKGSISALDKCSNRYPRVGGTRQHPFAGTNSKPQKLLENAPTPTSRVHAVLGGFFMSAYCRE